MRVVIGAGEVGSAVGAVLEDQYRVVYVDVDTPQEQVAATLRGHRLPSMHVAIPWSEHFVEEVRAYERLLRPELTVVHSTVPVGTCGPNGWCHAPVRGRHPHLEEGVRESPMVIGGQHAEQVAIALAKCGVKASFEDDPANTEAGKLWELAQLGIQVRVMQEIHDYCQQNDLDFHVVYTRFAQDYNEAYRQIDAKFVRPVLDYQPGPLGGHCVAQNSPLLGNPLVDTMLLPISPQPEAAR